VPADRCPLDRLGALVLVLCGLVLHVPAARADLEQEHEGWFQVTATGPIAGPFRLFLEAQPRLGTDPADGDTDLRALLIRGAVGWQVTPRWSLWAGYGYTPTFNPFRLENRAYEQSLYVSRLGPLTVQNRTRLEERLIEDTGGAAVRLRHYLGLAYPLPRWPVWSLIAADEPFLNLNTVSNGPVSGFDQNRLYLGVSRQFGPHARVEVDYLNQVVNGRHGTDDVMRNGAFMAVAFGW
jgi:Protein of unknown function (DUF2490)